MMIPNDAKITLGWLENHQIEHRKQKLGHRNHAYSTEVLSLVGPANCLTVKVDNFLYDSLIN